MRGSSTRFLQLFRLLLLAYPPEFQADCAAEMVETLRVRDAEERKRGGFLHMLRFRFRELRAVVRTGLRLRLHGRPTPPSRRERRRGGPRWRVVAESVGQDMRQVARGWRRNPLSTTVVVATLGLGIGATTAIFSIIDGVLLRGLPYHEAERLVQIINTLPEADIWFTAMSATELKSWRGQTQLFDGVEGYSRADFVVTGVDEPQRLAGAYATVGLLDFLGIRPQVGRGFLPDDAAASGDRVVMISDGLWRRRFAASPSVLGQRIALDHESYAIVGVMPRGFYLPSQQTQLWLPVRDVPPPEGRPSMSLDVLARIPAGMELPQAQALAETAARGMQEEGARRPNWGIQLRAKSDDRASTQTKESLYVLAGAVGFVLLISCANIANLALARATIRGRELTLRAALGAGRLRIVRQVLTESIAVGLLGGALGVVLAFWLLGAITHWAPDELTVLSESAIRIDVRVLLFATAVSLLAGVVSGLVPAIRGSRPGDDRAFGRPGKGSPLDGGGSRLRGTLVIAEVALSLVLLIGAGLMTGSFARLRSVEPGFQTDNVLVVELELDEGRYPTNAGRRAFFDQLLGMTGALPAAESVALAIGVPPQGGIVDVGPSPRVEDRPDEAAPPVFLASAMVSPGYFRTLRIPLLRGRTFTAEESTQEQTPVVINESLAHRYWGDDDPVGKRFRLSDEEPWLTVLGVVGDVNLGGMGEYGALQIYYPLTDDGGLYDRSLVVRTAGEPLDLAPAVEGQIHALDADLPIDRVARMNDLYRESRATPRFYLWLMSAFAAVAGVLAAVGIYGVTAYTVGLRTHEIGVRVALGAQRWDVLGLVLRHGMGQVLAGILLGLAGALALSRALAGMLYEIPATDPPTYFTVSGLLAAIALIASYLPARRATRADPLDALRDH